MAVLEYNRVFLPFCDVVQFRMEVVYDDQGQTDAIVTKFDIQAHTLITADALDMLAPDLYGKTDDPAAIVSFIHQQLMTPRQRLSFQFNEYEFIPQPQPGVKGYRDALNGPLPQSFTPIRLDEKSWWCTYHIIAHYVVDYDATIPDSLGEGRVRMTSLPGNTILFNRWEETAEIDQCQYTTKTRRGKSMIRSDNISGSLVDEVRAQMAAVSLPPGFVRNSSRYTMDPNGLGLVYEIVDKEVAYMPPSPALQADGDYTEQASKADGYRVGTATVELRGAKDTSRTQLVRTACNVAASTINLRNRNLGNPLLRIGLVPFVNRGIRGAGVLIGATIRWKLYDNACTVRMSAMLPKIEVRVGGVAFCPPTVNVTPGSNGTQPSPNLTLRGSAGLLLQAAAYYDPTIPDTKLGDGLLTGDDTRIEIGPQKLQLTRGVEPGRNR